MCDINKVLRDVERAAAWLQDVAGAVVSGQMPLTPNRAKKILSAFTAVDEARTRYTRALMKSGMPGEQRPTPYEIRGDADPES